MHPEYNQSEQTTNANGAASENNCENCLNIKKVLIPILIDHKNKIKPLYKGIILPL